MANRHTRRAASTSRSATRDARAASQLTAYAPFFRTVDGSSSSFPFSTRATQQNTTLAAPASAVLRNGRPIACSTAPLHPPDSRRARSLPLVTIAPGCAAKNATRLWRGVRDASHAAASARAKKTAHSLLSPYARIGSWFARVASCASVSRSRRTPPGYEKRCAAEVTNTTRAGAFSNVASSSPRNARNNRRVSRTGAKTFTCMWRSWPSRVRAYGAGMSPALCTRRCSGRLSRANASANARTEANDSRSTWRLETRHDDDVSAGDEGSVWDAVAAARASSWMTRAASAPAMGSRQARMTASAPPSANARAVSKPIPELAPVMTTTLPVRVSRWALLRTTSIAVERLEKPLRPRIPARWPIGQHAAHLRSNARAGDDRLSRRPMGSLRHAL